MLSSRQLRKLGRLCFTLMWIPFIGIFIGMAKMPTGSYDWVELPLLTRISMIAAGGFMALSMLLQFGSSMMSGAQNRSLQSNGQIAEATIKGIESTGQTVNDYYVGMSFLLDVRPMNEPSFQARTEKLVPMHMISQYTIGGSVQVRFDPDSKTVAFVDDSQPQS